MWMFKTAVLNLILLAYILPKQKSFCKLISFQIPYINYQNGNLCCISTLINMNWQYVLLLTSFYHPIIYITRNFFDSTRYCHFWEDSINFVNKFATEHTKNCIFNSGQNKIFIKSGIFIIFADTVTDVIGEFNIILITTTMTST